MAENETRQGISDWQRQSSVYAAAEALSRYTMGQLVPIQIGIGNDAVTVMAELTGLAIDTTEQDCERLDAEFRISYRGPKRVAPAAVASCRRKTSYPALGIPGLSRATLKGNDAT